MVGQGLLFGHQKVLAHDIDGTLSRLVGSHVEASKFDAKIAANHLKLSLLIFLTSFIIPRTLNPQAKFSLSENMHCAFT